MESLISGKQIKSTTIKIKIERKIRESEGEGERLSDRETEQVDSMR